MSKLGELKRTRNIYLFCTAAFFAAMPTKAFLAISSDIIQVAAILLPFTIAFMIVIATGDIGAGLPRNEVISQRLGNRRNSMTVQLIEIISSNLQLIAGTIGAKALCVWLQDCGRLSMIVSHFAAVVVAILIVLCVGKFAGIIPMFNYLAAGAELGSAVKNNKLTGE